MQDSKSTFRSSQTETTTVEGEIADASASQGVPCLLVEAAESFNYAAWQNAVPLLHKVTIENPQGSAFSSLTIELQATPGFAKDRCWRVDRIGAGEKLTIRDIDLDIDPGYLDRLDEAERGILSFRLICEGNVLHEVNHVLRVLARDEWGGLSTMGILLPAFVTPNDPALAALLKSAAAVLGNHGHSTALEGYQSEDRNRTYLLAAALWSAVAGRSLVYANPPVSFEEVGQKTRRVGTVLGDGLATCLDLSLLFASALEAIGLNPVLVMTHGHCFAGVWLVEKTFKRQVERDCSELRKAIAAKELIVFETTLVTHQPPAQFMDAEATANASLVIDKDQEFLAVIDVGRSRMSQIRPLASHAARKEPIDTEPESGPLPLPAAPGFSTLPAEPVEELPQTPAGRIDRWQRKLLDLSLRNRLLNFRSSKQAVPVLCPDLSRLEDCLADGARLRLVSREDGNALGQRNPELHQKRTRKDLEEEFARQALDRNEVCCPVDSRDLEGRLTTLFRRVRNDLAEGGTNTLYLAVGFLRWKQNPTDEKSYMAPLLLVPVTLTRRSASSPFYLTGHEDEVRFNSTLLQMLKNDFACNPKGFEPDLPMDDSGVDIPQVLERMRQVVRDIPGFEVVEEAEIATFSFAKYLMWKDLVDRVGQLEHNRVVHHLIHEPDKAYMSGGTGSMPRPEEIDRRYTPKDIVHPLAADSSQLAAVMAASEGHDLVIVGPPGTGKSQTIANLIAQCLAVGKTVLFVAEKTAALDVVYRRLREHGLGDCCIELHSIKAERRRFIGQLGASWNNRGTGDKYDWLEISNQLHACRDQLNDYAAAIHTPGANGWTPYRAMGTWVRGRQHRAPDLGWPATDQHDPEDYSTLCATIVELASTFDAVPAVARTLRVEATEWSMAWETALLESCRRLTTAAELLAVAMETFRQTLGISPGRCESAEQLPQLYRLAKELAQPGFPATEILFHVDLDNLAASLKTRSDLLERRIRAKDLLESGLVQFCKTLGIAATDVVPETVRRPLFRLIRELGGRGLPPAELLFHSQFEMLERTLADRSVLLHNQAQAFKSLESRSFNPVLINRIPVDKLERTWNRAMSSFWPLSAWKKNIAKKKLRAYLNTGGKSNPKSTFRCCVSTEIPGHAWRTTLHHSNYRHTSRLPLKRMQERSIPDFSQHDSCVKPSIPWG